MRQKYEASPKAQTAGPGGEVNLLELRMAWQAHLERIIHELRRSLIYYKEQAEGRRVGQVYFLGGGCQIKNLVDYLIKQIGGSCQIISPFKNMQILKILPPEEPASAAVFSNAVSLGLAMLAKGGGKDTLNFLPAEFKRKALDARRRLTILIATTCLLALSALMDINVLVNGYSLQAYLKQTALELNKTKNTGGRLKELDQLESGFRRRQVQIETVVKQRKDFYLLLKGFAQIIPREILISKIDIFKSEAAAFGTTTASAPTGQQPSSTSSATQTAQAKYRISLAGQVFSDYEEADKIIEKFRASLASMPHLSNIKVTPLALEKISLEEAARTNQPLRLTQPKERDFTLSAEVNAQ